MKFGKLECVLFVLFNMLVASPALAQWQVPDHAVPIGRGGAITGFRNAAPGTADYPFLSNSGTSDPSFRRLPNAGLVPGAANTVKGSLNGTTTSDLVLTSCSALYQITQWVSGAGWQCGTISVLPSRAVALTLNLSAFQAVQTQGYAVPGDGGEAFFDKRTAPSFIDSFPAPCTFVGGTGYVNGTYRGIYLTGGTGRNVIAMITVAGTAVTAVDYAASPGWHYSVGDILTTANTNLGGTGSGFTCTVGSVSTPSGSFSDIAANRWQIIRGASDNNVKQFGVKNDWTLSGGDAAATNNFTTMQNAWFYAGYDGLSGGTIDGGGSAGSRMRLPSGTMLVCGGATSLILPPVVAIDGQNIWASTIKMCDSGQNNNVHFITICNPNTHLACFGSELRNLTLYASFAHTSDANIAMLFSNNIQQVDFLNRIAIYAGRRNCIQLVSGFGGAALLGMQNVECTPGSGGVNAGIKINYGTTLVTMRNVHVETGGTQAINGLEIGGGFVDLVGFHSEGIVTPIYVNIPTTNVNGVVRLHGLTGGAGCTDLVLVQGGSANDSVIIGGPTVYNGCTNTYNNGGAGSGQIVVTTDVLIP